MESLGSILRPTLEFLQTGFDQVNAAQGLIIALFATVLMRRWAQLFAVAAGASVVHVLVDTVVPIVTKGAALKLPPILTSAFWNYAIALFVGFVIVVAMFFAVRQVVFPGKRGAGGPAKAH